MRFKSSPKIAHRIFELLASLPILNRQGIFEDHLTSVPYRLAGHSRRCYADCCSLNHQYLSDLSEVIAETGARFLAFA